MYAQKEEVGEGFYSKSFKIYVTEVTELAEVIVYHDNLEFSK